MRQRTYQTVIWVGVAPDARWVDPCVLLITPATVECRGLRVREKRRRRRIREEGNSPVNGGADGGENREIRAIAKGNCDVFCIKFCSRIHVGLVFLSPCNFVLLLQKRKQQVLRWHPPTAPPTAHHLFLACSPEFHMALAVLDRD